MVDTPDPYATRIVPYAGADMRVLGGSPHIVFAEMSIPAGFQGPPPHIHHDFDEALYLIEGDLTMIIDREDPVEMRAGSLIFAPRGRRHTFANPASRDARIVGTWCPGTAIAFMEEIGAALPASGPADPEALREIYRRHNSVIVP